MTRCPKCGSESEGHTADCVTCGMSLEGTTQSFAPIAASDSQSADIVAEATGPALVVRKGPEIGERFVLERPRLTIGRDPAADIFLNDVTVSRSHAVVELIGAEVSISDVGSLNGTYVNGVSVDKAILTGGDIVQVGLFQMVFITGGEV
ncbi:MAG: FHA domain-containing protein [Coriobacteriia bacterium]|nr:FHA domain-containing protein [Coriobacteriia bacterium]